jgi:hypothetical protein
MDMDTYGYGHALGNQRATRSVAFAAGTRTEYFSRAVLTKATPNKQRDSPSISSPVRNAGLWFNNKANIGVSHYGFILDRELKTRE